LGGFLYDVFLLELENKKHAIIARTAENSRLQVLKKSQEPGLAALAMTERVIFFDLLNNSLQNGEYVINQSSVSLSIGSSQSSSAAAAAAGLAVAGAAAAAECVENMLDKTPPIGVLKVFKV